jgi:hypothetical protein
MNQSLRPAIRALCALVTLSLLPAPAWAIQNVSGTTQAPSAAPASPSSVILTATRPTRVRIPAGTPIDVHLDAPLSSQHSRTNDLFTFTVVHPVVVAGMLVVAQGAQGQGHVTYAHAAEFLGRSGVLTLAYDWVVGEDNEKIRLAGQAASIGGGNTDTELAGGAAADIASAVVPFAGFAGLAIRGKKAEIGTQDTIRVYVEATVHIRSDELAKFDDGFAH